MGHYPQLYRAVIKRMRWYGQVVRMPEGILPGYLLVVRVDPEAGRRGREGTCTSWIDAVLILSLFMLVSSTTKLSSWLVMDTVPRMTQKTQARRLTDVRRPMT